MTHLSNEDLENSRFDQRLNLWFGILKIGIIWVTLNVRAPSLLIITLGAGGVKAKF
jgi:hypothetical protein